MLPSLIAAVGKLCRIMFMRANPLVAASFSCPYNVTGVACLVADLQQQVSRSRRWDHRRWWRHKCLRR